MVKLTEHQIEILINLVEEKDYIPDNTRTMNILLRKGFVKTVKKANKIFYEITNHGYDELSLVRPQ